MLEDTLKSWEFDLDKEMYDDHCWEYNHDNAAVLDGTDIERWRIEEQDLAVEVAVKVHGGLCSLPLPMLMWILMSMTWTSPTSPMKEKKMRQTREDVCSRNWPAGRIGGVCGDGSLWD